MTKVRLEWDGKSADVPRLHLPLQVVETVGSPRADRDSLFEGLADSPAAEGWRNRLIWGDNLHVLASLADELAGQVDLVYIDPPFDSRQDYKVRIAVGDGDAGADTDLTKISSVLEEKAYRDTWGSGVDSYLQMLYQRLILLRELLSDRGSLFLHLAPNVSHHARAILDEVFGPENFRAEIIWKRTTAHSDGGQGGRQFGPVHDVIAYYSKSENFLFNGLTTKHDENYVKAKYPYQDESTGRRYGLWDMTGPGGAGKGNPRYEVLGVTRYWRYSAERMTKLLAEGRVIQPQPGAVPRYKRYLDESSGIPLQDIWADLDPINSQAKERLGYDTQKPEALLERIVRSSSDENSIVLDCFVGSGTTPAVAERLGRRWIAVDIGRFAIHTTRKRLLGQAGCKPFIVANLGRYERQVWQQATTGEQFRAYLDFIVDLYGAQPVEEFMFLHGAVGRRAVHVGAVDAAVSYAEIKDAIDEARSAGYHSLDVLGWEWEMGLHELVQDEARSAGVNLVLRRIPREIMDRRAVDAGEIVFHELAFVRLETAVARRTVTVTLADFVLPNPELIPPTVREKIKSWKDYVDYWAVDFTFGADGDADTFRNAWQSYRSRSRRALDLAAVHLYSTAGTHTILVKVVDIFGNDTTTAVEVVVE